MQTFTHKKTTPVHRTSALHSWKLMPTRPPTTLFCEVWYYALVGHHIEGLLFLFLLFLELSLLAETFPVPWQLASEVQPIFLLSMFLPRHPSRRTTPRSNLPEGANRTWGLPTTILVPKLPTPLILLSPKATCSALRLFIPMARFRKSRLAVHPFSKLSVVLTLTGVASAPLAVEWATVPISRVLWARGIVHYPPGVLGPVGPSPRIRPNPRTIRSSPNRPQRSRGTQNGIAASSLEIGRRYIPRY